MLQPKRKKESELESTGNLIGGLILWAFIAFILGLIAGSGVSWGLWALGGWIAFLIMDVFQAHLLHKRMYIRFLSELWWLPF